MMGDHHAVERAKLPPDVVKMLLAMQPGQVSDLLQFGGAYQIIRLNAHIPAGMRKFDEVKDSLQKQCNSKSRNNSASAWTRSCAPTPRWKSCSDVV